MRLMLCALKLAAAFNFASSALALTPLIDGYVLQCRANFSAAFNLPAGSFFTNATPAVNDHGQVALNLLNVNIPGDDVPGVWFGASGAGQVEFLSADPDASIGSVAINATGYVVFPQNFTAPNGVYFYDSSLDVGGLLTTQPIGATSYSTPIVNDSGAVGYRVSFSGPNAWASYQSPPAVLHAVEATLDPLSPYSFLFTPSFNNDRKIAGKARRGGPGQTGNSQPDEIVTIAPDGATQVIARDRDADPNSIFRSFDNSVALTNNGWVAFIADVFPTGRGVFLSNGVETRTIALQGQNDVGSIESFGPAANRHGVVAFRALDGGNLRCIWIGDGTTLRKVVREHDIVPTDLGPGRIDQNDSSPVFGGSITINSFGDVAFNAALTPPDNNQVEWGSGAFVAVARTPGDVNCDGAVNFGDIDPLVAALGGQAAYEALYPNCRWRHADCDGDNDVDFGDIDPFVQLLQG